MSTGCGTPQQRAGAASRPFRARKMSAVVALAALLAASAGAAPTGSGGAARAQAWAPAQQAPAQSRSLCDVGGAEQFPDVEAGSYAAAYILCARAVGLTRGDGSGGFGPDRTLTRAQMAAFLARLWRDVLGRDCPTAPAHGFTDVEGSFAAGDIACLYALGVTKGTTAAEFSPQATLTTAQVTRFTARLLSKASLACRGLAEITDELKLRWAAGCLTTWHVAPSTAEAIDVASATRAQMAVYLVGAWHNAARHGVPPQPPVKPAPLPTTPPATATGLKFTHISAGEWHTCGITTDKAAVCWGSNRYGQSSPPAGLELTAISAGKDHTCGIDTDSTFVCWGDSDFYDAHHERSGELSLPPVDVKFTHIAVGASQTCGITTDKALVCWGEFSQYNDGILDGHLPIPADVELTDISTRDGHTCGITVEKRAVCWGPDAYGGASPPAGLELTAISAGSGYTCGIRTDDTPVCWGGRDIYTIFDKDGNYTGEYEDADAVSLLPAGLKLTAISAGDPSYACGIRADSTYVCWGYEVRGVAPPPEGLKLTAISAGGAHTCGIAVGGTAVCWGDNQNMQSDVPEWDVPAPGLTVAVESPAPEFVAGDFNVTVTFSSAVQDLPLSSLRTANATVVELAGSGARYSATIRPSAAGAVMVRVLPGLEGVNGSLSAASDPLFRVNTADAARDRPGIDTWDRAAVAQSAHTEFTRTEPDRKFTGSADNCIAGATSQAFRDSVFRRINWYRKMAGLAPVTENPAYSAGAQQAALIMHAAGGLSHHPGSDWPCYTEAGADAAASSNLHIGTPVGGYEANGRYESFIESYMADAGAGNEPVGHRRWIIYPRTQQMGTGDFSAANALWVLDDNRVRGDRPPVREERGFVAWPPSGHVPWHAVWGRWSFSLEGADFSAAAVSMSDDSGPVEAAVIARNGASGEPAIVWATARYTESTLLPQPVGSDRCYTVAVSGVKIDGAVQDPYEYAVCAMIEP